MGIETARGVVYFNSFPFFFCVGWGMSEDGEGVSLERELGDVHGVCTLESDLHCVRRFVHWQSNRKGIT
jgi:hypothetical protein